MPLIFKATPHSEKIIGVWETSESLDFLLSSVTLTDEEKDNYAAFLHDTRRKQWLAVRLLTKELTGDFLPISYNEFEKPYIANGSWKISISHSKDKAAIILCKHKDCGIDIESYHPKIEELASKFISNEEMKFLSENHRKEQIHLIWGAKEALYKLYGKGNIIFNENLKIFPFDYKEKGTITAMIIVPTLIKKLTLDYEKLNEFTLVYVVDE
jgi:4'-phosphopantetheinyl transferase